MKGKSVIAAVLWFAGFALILAFPAHVPGRGQAELQAPDFEARWLKSGDPCLPAKIRKEWLTKTYGQDVSYLKCYPLLVDVTWDIEETYSHHSNLGTDTFSFSCRASFPASLQVDCDQKKRDLVERFHISGPAPCCPGDVSLAVNRADASFLIAKDKVVGQSFKTFKTSDTWSFEIKAPEQAFFVFSWSRPGSLGAEPARGVISAPSIKLSKGVVPEPYQPAGGIHQYITYKITLGEGKSLSWDDIKPHLERQTPLDLEYPIDVREVHDYATPLIETHTVKGKVSVRIAFGEQETETWQVTVLGKERDPDFEYVEYQGLDKKTKKEASVHAEFDWLLEGTYLVKKVKKVASYESGIINAYSQTPLIVQDPPDLYSCMLLPCQGRETYKETGKFVKTLLFGKVAGQIVQLTWPNHPAEVCVNCAPKKDARSLKLFRRQFKAENFIDRVNSERLPLKDGAVVNGSDGDWLAYSIALKRIR